MCQAHSHIRAMSEPSATYPYVLEVQPNPHAKGSWQWAIRQNGKLIQRSDRAANSELTALARGLEQIEKLIHGAYDERR